MQTPDALVRQAAAELRQVCGKSPGRRRMAATFLRLGEHASLRDVLDRTGGSFRDVTPVGRACRKHRGLLAAWLGDTAANESLQAVAALVLSATDEVRDEQRRQADALLALQANVRRLEVQADAHGRAQTMLAQQATMDRQFQSLATRVDSIARKADEAQLLSADPNSALVNIVSQLQAEVAALADAMTAVQAPAEALHPAVKALEQQVAALNVTCIASTEPTDLAALLTPIERRLVALSAAIEQLKKPRRRRKSPRRTTRAAATRRRPAAAKRKPRARRGRAVAKRSNAPRVTKTRFTARRGSARQAPSRRRKVAAHPTQGARIVRGQPRARHRRSLKTAVKFRSRRAATKTRKKR